MTLTGIYNVLEKLRTGAALTPKDKMLHEHGLVGVLKTLHNELDIDAIAANFSRRGRWLRWDASTPKVRRCGLTFARVALV